MDKKCICGGHICSYINMTDLAECCDCNKYYKLEDGKWNNISKSDFRVLFRKNLIKQQQSNK